MRANSNHAHASEWLRRGVAALLERIIVRAPPRDEAYQPRDWRGEALSLPLGSIAAAALSTAAFGDYEKSDFNNFLHPR